MKKSLYGCLSVLLILMVTFIPFSATFAKGGVSPSVNTDGATNITQTSATLNGTITNQGTASVPTLESFNYGTDTNYASSSVLRTAAAPSYTNNINIVVSAANVDYIAIDANYNIYVDNSLSNQIEEFDQSGTLINQFGSTGTGNGQFQFPAGLTVDSSGNLYVADYGNNRIQKFDSSGHYLSQFAGSGGNALSNPIALTIDSSGNIVVIDNGHYRVETFTPTGTFVSQFGSQGTGNGQFEDPRSVAVDVFGNYYVVDVANSTVQKFDHTGTYVGQLTGPFNAPWNIAIDPTSGNMLVANSGNGTINMFDPVGTYVTSFGSAGSGGHGQFIQLVAVAFDPFGNAYGVDHSGSMIEKFSYFPTSFSQTITRLTCGTTYHYQATVTNQINGISGAGNGADATFTTSPCASTTAGNISGGSLWFCTDPSATNYQGSFQGVKVTSGCTYASTPTPVINAPSVANQAPVATPSPLFTMTLTLGSENPQVKALQHYLNTHGFPVAKTGIGSLHHENDVFGSATKAAVIAFQKSKHIVANGVVGPQTIKVLNQ